ncbi:MAG: NADH-quinone oxidoreductase subunit J [Alphaproteobacteria bacterium]|nr:NADH-quinone oxidoreductase subunit J [Alphaproteobacteria bacterium]
MLQVIAFYALATVAVLSAFLVVAARNPVHSVMWLITAFFSSAGLFVLLGAEFLAMLLVVVYVGAVAVLFLFVVMMLDVDFTSLKQGFLSYLPLGGLIALILAGELILVGNAWNAADIAARSEVTATPADMNNVQALGHLIYDEYVYFFQAAGMVLLVAMVGAIVLTLRHRPNVKRQKAHIQVGRDRKTAVELQDIKSGEGIG